MGYVPVARHLRQPADGRQRSFTHRTGQQMNALHNLKHLAAVVRAHAAHLPERIAFNDDAAVSKAQHSVADGWSLRTLRREFWQQYAQLSRAEPGPLPPLGVQLADY